MLHVRTMLLAALVTPPLPLHYTCREEHLSTAQCLNSSHTAGSCTKYFAIDSTPNACYSSHTDSRDTLVLYLSALTYHVRTMHTTSLCLNE